MAHVVRSHAQLSRQIADTETLSGVGAFWWLGQHSFIVRAGSSAIYIDPFFADWESRQTPPLLSPQEVDNADLVLVTHGHADHLCPESLRGIASASPHAIFICPGPEAPRLESEAGIDPSRIRPMTDRQSIVVRDVTIGAIKSKHEFFDEHPHLGFPYLGYVFEAGDLTFYHAGDGILYEGLIGSLRRWPRFDCLFLPINGRDAERFLAGCIGNMTYQEAVELSGELQPGLVVPSHYDMFLGNQEDPHKFVRYLAAKFPSVQSWVGPAGERVWVRR